MKLEAIVNHETSRIHSTCIVVSRAQAQHLHKGARWLRCLHCRLTARRSWVRFPHGALLALGGRSSRECTVLRQTISRAFLCGVCMFSPCSQGVSSTKDPNRKNMQNNRTHVHP